MQYATLIIEFVIMHQILRKSTPETQPVLSDVPTPMSEDDRKYVQLRIRKALGTFARPVIEDTDTSSVPKDVRAYLNGPPEALLEVSQALAKRLQEKQPTVSPGGIFVAASASLDGARALLIAKLEHEQGVRAHPKRLEDGSTTFDIELLTDLLFTTGSKVFKVALFTSPDKPEEALTGVVADRQMSGSSVAQFFLVDFLGCKLAEKADLLTERFHNQAQSWINAVKDAEKKGRYEVALLGELQSNRTVLSVGRFAGDHLDVDDRDDFAAAMTGASVPSGRPFQKDVSLIKSRISRLKLETAAGVTVLAPAASIDDGIVSIENNADETATVVVRDRVTKFSGHGALSKAGQ